MASFEYILPATQGGRAMDWKNARFEGDTATIWGNSHTDRTWGGAKTGSKGILQLSDPVEQADGSFVLTITLHDPEPVIDAEALAFLSRYNLEDGFYGVICTMLQEGRPAIHS